MSASYTSRDGRLAAEVVFVRPGVRWLALYERGALVARHELRLRGPGWMVELRISMLARDWCEAGVGPTWKGERGAAEGARRGAPRASRRVLR
jgi:hypothetical protein